MNATFIRAYGTIAISVMVTLNFLGLIVTVFFITDAPLRGTLMTVLVQTAAVNFTSVVGYFVGSSAGSAQKDEKLEQQMPPK